MDSKTIKHIASLARIKLTVKEEENNQKELSLILDYVKQLNKVETDKIEPLYQVTGLVNSMREDKDDRIGVNKGLNKKLVEQAPEQENGFIRVKAVLNK